MVDPLDTMRKFKTLISLDEVAKRTGSSKSYLRECIKRGKRPSKKLTERILDVYREMGIELINE